jgi:AbrB family looped-hinge helix DNA binding protein
MKILGATAQRVKYTYFESPLYHNFRRDESPKPPKTFGISWKFDIQASAVAPKASSSGRSGHRRRRMSAGQGRNQNEQKSAQNATNRWWQNLIFLSIMDLEGGNGVISENLLTLRKRHRYSQEQVAERIGVSRQAVAKWENGETLPDLGNCEKLAALYDVTLDELVHYDSRESALPIAPKGKYIFGTVTLGEKGQIVIPVKARKLFNLKPGDDLVILGDIAQGLAMVKADFLIDLVHARQKEGEQP